MTDVFSDGNIRVQWVTAISNIALPTTTELNLGTRLDSTMTADGLIGFEAETQPVETTPLSGIFDTELPGRSKFSGNGLRLKKQNGGDAIFTLLAPNTTGFVVIRRSIAAATAYATGQKLEVYPSTTGVEKYLAPEANTVERYEVPIFVSSQPNLRAAVA
jgi:hypothetical protein